jgi:hypothetical protein
LCRFAFILAIAQTVSKINERPEMTEPGKSQEEKSERPRYHWPRFLLAAILLAIMLAILWLSFEIRRTQRIRDLNSNSPRLQP